MSKTSSSDMNQPNVNTELETPETDKGAKNQRPARSQRHAARSVAFQILYALHFSEIKDEAALAQAFAESPDQHDALPPEAEGKAPHPSGFTWELVRGVWSKEKELDKIIEGFSQNWKLSRIGRVELTLLRIAVYELLFQPNTPPKVAINEALELIKEFGDMKSQGFINGVLDSAAKALENGTLRV